MSFLDTLISQGLIREGAVSRILKDAEEKFGGNVDDAIIASGIDDKQLLAIKSQAYGIPMRTIDVRQIPFELFSYIPEESARHYQIVPIGLKDGVLEVGFSDPDNRQAVDALQFISAKSQTPFKLFLISRADLKGVLASYSGTTGGGEVEHVTKEVTELSEAVNDVPSLDAVVAKPMKNDKGETIVEDAPIIKIVAVMLRNAIEGGASDIHIEHAGDRVKVRFRVDGVLHTTLVLPLNVYAGVIARIKILSQIRLDEKRKPQDGAFSAKIADRKVDFRVSILPTYYGEKAVIRILDSENGVKPLDKIGFSPENLAMIREGIKRPYGLFLVTGPTGSGKTTTLYSILNELNKDEKNIVSLEDPVEYHIPGVNQSQVLPEIGYTFATGLRAILRQDPNIIYVGEIRDKETAELAIQAALTGHLVFSTLHTNSAIGAIPRLIDMGIDPYLIAPTLIMSVAERLVPTLYQPSKKKIPMDEATRAVIVEQFKDLPEQYRSKVALGNDIYEPGSVPECVSGMRGRMAVFEMFMVDKDIESIILKSPTEPDLYAVLRQKGMLSMREDAIQKALRGDIPFTEVYNFE